MSESTKANILLQRLNEMSFSRNSWVSRVRDRFFGGALGEYAKLVIARKIGIPEKDYTYWVNEVSTLLGSIESYMDKGVVATDGKYSRKKMLLEAFREAATFQDQITAAKNELLKKYTEHDRNIRTLAMDMRSKELIADMIREFYLNINLY